MSPSHVRDHGVGQFAGERSFVVEQVTFDNIPFVNGQRNYATLATFDGMTLHRTAVPGYSKTLAGATTGPDGLWVVGLGGALYHYDGAPAAVAGFPPVFLRGVSAPGGGEVWACGFDATVAGLWFDEVS